MITLTYIFLHTLLLCVFYKYSLKFGKNISYWKVAMLPIVFFSLEEGLRWGRFIDWCAYYDIYYNGLETSNFEFLFKEWWLLFSKWNIPYPVVMIICSLLFIVSLFVLFKPYYRLFSVCFPVLIALTVLSFENFIRWYVALSVILISFRYFLDKKYIKMLFLIFLVPFLHVGILPVGIIIFLVAFWKHPINPLFIICISVGLVLLFQSSFMLNFINVANFFFGSVEKFSGYMNNLEGWLTGIGQNSDVERKATIVYLVSMLPLYSVIYAAYKMREDFSSELIIMYNLSILGIILLSVSSGLELLQRYAEIFYPFLVLLLAYTVKHISSCKQMNLFVRRVIKWGCYVFIAYKLVLFIWPLSDEAFMCYVWNYQLPPNVIFNLY